MLVYRERIQICVYLFYNLNEYQSGVGRELDVETKESFTLRKAPCLWQASSHRQG